MLRFTRETREKMKIVIGPALGSVFKKIALLMFKEQASRVKNKGITPIFENDLNLECFLR